MPLFATHWRDQIVTKAVYDGLGDLFRSDGYDLDVAEIQGGLVGLICAGASLDGKNWVKPLNDLNGTPVEPTESTATAVGALIEQTKSQLADPAMSFQLMLPDDETSIESRTEALANWCNGFLSGLSLAGVTDLESMGEDAVDFVRDLTQIARAGLVADANLDADENALFEITEYARVGSVLVYETLRGPVEQDNIH